MQQRPYKEHGPRSLNPASATAAAGGARRLRPSSTVRPPHHITHTIALALVHTHSLSHHSRSCANVIS